MLDFVKDFISTALEIWSHVRYFLAAMFGAFVLYILNIYNDRKPFSFFKALEWDLKGRPNRILCDMGVSSFIGAVIVVILTTPNSTTDAFVGGLGFTGLLVGAIKSNE